MLIGLNVSSLETCAATIAALAGGQCCKTWACLSWVIRNRLQALPPSGGDSSNPAVGLVCEDVLREALGGQRDEHALSLLSPAARFRLHAVNSLVWAGDLADETGGATACHRHDKSPAWARRRTPTALLGAFLFFR